MRYAESRKQYFFAAISYDQLCSVAGAGIETHAEGSDLSAVVWLMCCLEQSAIAKLSFLFVKTATFLLPRCVRSSPRVLLLFSFLSWLAMMMGFHSVRSPSSLTRPRSQTLKAWVPRILRRGSPEGSRGNPVTEYFSLVPLEKHQTLLN